jgi:hypothetical protein
MCLPAMAADTGRVYLRKVRFQPRTELSETTPAPGSAIDENSAKQGSDQVRQQLVAAGYRDAKVDAKIVPVGFRQADLVVHIDRGTRYRIREVHFTGHTAFEEKKLRHEIHALGEPYSDASMQGAIARLRAFYVSQGYFDAKISLDSSKVLGGDKASMTVAVESGTRYRANGADFNARDVCAHIFEARREAERQGVLDFDPRVELSRLEGDPASVTMTMQIGTGERYTVGRISFRGNHAFDDTTVRRAFVLNEGEPFDMDKLRRSLVRINQMGVFAPPADPDISLTRDEATHTASVTVSLHQKPRGWWGLSGPVVPVGLVGPFDGSVISRLPSWGHGIFEGSTYFGSFSLLGFLQPVSNIVSLMPQSGILPFWAIQRPLLPGQIWTSGFTIAPLLGWQGMALAYGMSHLHEGFSRLLWHNVNTAPPLAVTVEWFGLNGGPVEAGPLVCEAPKPSLAKLRKVLSVANDVVLGTHPF